MHVIHTGRNGIAGIEVISHPTAHHESKREVLSLCPDHPFGSLSVNAPKPEASVKVGHNSPVRPDKITSNTHVISPIPCFRTPGDHSEGPAESKIPIAAQNPRTSYVVHLPSERSDDGYQRVLKRSFVIRVTQEKVESKRDIDGKPSPFQREFELVFVIDAPVEISRFRV